MSNQPEYYNATANGNFYIVYAGHMTYEHTTYHLYVFKGGMWKSCGQIDNLEGFDMVDDLVSFNRFFSIPSPNYF